MNGKWAAQYQHMFGSNLQWTKHLRLFREASTVKLARGTSLKLADRGVQRMMVGYAKHHDGDVYHMWNLVIEQVHVTCDIIFMNQTMFQKWVVEDEAQMLPDVEASIVEWGNQDISAEEELEAKAEVGQETSNTEENEE